MDRFTSHSCHSTDDVETHDGRHGPGSNYDHDPLGSDHWSDEWGSVQDAETVKHYLEEGATPVDIVILTATTPSSPSSGRPIEELKLWPTSVSVVSALKRILDKAQPEDFVYLHYSGHGMQTPSDAPPGPNSTAEWL